MFHFIENIIQFLINLHIFVAVTNEIVSSISFSEISLLYIGMPWIFVHLFCILQLCLLFLIFFSGIFKVFYIKNHITCKKWQFYFFTAHLDAFYFLSCLNQLTKVFEGPNYKALLRDWKRHKWKDMPYSRIGGINIVTMSLLTK